MPNPTRIRTRFAPSPTGYLHIGSLRTALFAFLFARQKAGQFILRIEDTDQARFVEGAIEKIIHTLHQVGLDYDEGIFAENGEITSKGEFAPYLQSERRAIYKEYAEKLVESGHAYYCFCDEKRLEELRKEQEALKKPTHYDRKCRNLGKQERDEFLIKGLKPVIRQAIPLEGQTVVKDLVYKEIVYDNENLDDQILLKSDGYPTYHLAVVVDDHLMEVSHVIRGEEWIPSTPKHILLYKAFNWDPPAFAHLPLLLNKDHTKLSKRQGDVAVEDYLEKGYLKEALINFVALLGWNPKTNEEIFSLKDLIAQFDFSKVNKSGAVFDVEKLDWLNGIYVRKMDIAQLAEMAIPYLIKSKLVFPEADGKFQTQSGKLLEKGFISAVVKLEQERLKKLSEIGERVGYFFDRPNFPNPEILIWRKSSIINTKNILKKISELLHTISDDEFGSPQALQQKFKDFISVNNLDNGSVLWPLRVALSGLEASPGPFEIMSVLQSAYGKSEIIERVATALKALE